MTRTQLTPLFIGSFLSVALITTYLVASQLISYAAAVLIASTNVITPWATVLYARDKHAEQRQLHIQGEMLCGLVALLSDAASLARRTAHRLVDRRWCCSGSASPGHSALGEFLPNTQFVTYCSIMAAARHCALALFLLAETGIAVLLMLLLMRPLGLVGACIALAVSATFCRGLALMLQGCWLTGTGLGSYVMNAILAPLACAVLPAAALGAMLLWHRPANWLQLILYIAIYTILFVLNTGLLLGLGNLRNARHQALAKAIGPVRFLPGGSTSRGDFAARCGDTLPTCRFGPVGNRTPRWQSPSCG